ncbi:hypothetical protein VF21_04473 [Pseudogymnoascus sp. 05NY08]|nr:hypothetical protein VF21_04473 [Pseudogymnoascus sp. 05NY08]
MAHLLRQLSSSPMSVMLTTAIIYLSIAIPLLVIHEVVPPAPSDDALPSGLNISEAWLDLAELTKAYHPYASRRNDEVHEWLLRRVEGILGSNGVSWSSENGHIPISPQEFGKADGGEQTAPFPGFIGVETNGDIKEEEELRKRDASPLVTIFNDLQSNVTCSGLGAIGADGKGRLPGQTVYFEGTNIIVYIRGTEDEEGEWWKSSLHLRNTHGQGGILVNAHYDSVSTGFGATDDGVGVVTILQLIRYFTSTGRQPKKGIVALFNNGEEDFLNGARAYTQHPMSLFTHTFLNLEGAGAGGRAVLFRSTDTEVTRAYAKSSHPFGSVVGGDGFKQGMIRSQTDYVVFEDILGLRGLDVSFWTPRARYHTNQDNARHTSRDSIWHMLSTSISTVEALTSDTSGTFNSPRGDNSFGKVKNGKGSDGVWFDLFGKGFAVFGLRTLFAWSLTFLIACPLAIILTIYLLIREDKFYLFSSSVPSQGGSDEADVPLNGWRGAFRWPLTFIVATALTVGSGMLIVKINPLIIYSSQYSVWTMALTLNFCVFWFIMRGADFVRPSALHRTYAYFWMFILGWIILVAVTVLEDRFKIASGYYFVFYEIAIFFALAISLLELFALPTKTQYAAYIHAQDEAVESINALPDSDALIAPTEDEHPEQESAEAAADEAEEQEPTESTPLFGGDGAGRSRTTTFANYARRSFRRVRAHDGSSDSITGESEPYGLEQSWSGKLPRWTWAIQLLLLAPLTLILLGQIGLLVVTATGQTGPDGSALLVPYVLLTTFATLLLLPLTPTLHRFTYHLPTFLFLLFTGTLIYNLTAFPFSAENRYKAYFQQTIDLDTGSNLVTISGLETFVRELIKDIPSASGQDIECTTRPLRAGVTFCSYTGTPPQVVPGVPGVPPEKSYADWLSYTATRERGTNKATIRVSGKNTRSCAIRFARPVKDVKVTGAGTDTRFDVVPQQVGSGEVKLWKREWEGEWEVEVEWGVGEGKKVGEEGMEGRVVCLWADFNERGVIPALDEVVAFVPGWVGVSKLSDGLVEGSKAFNV